METTHTKVIHVELKEPFLGRRHHYFGSVAAIYDCLLPETVGATLETARRHLKQNWEYQTPNGTIIRKSTLYRKEQGRNK